MKMSKVIVRVYDLSRGQAKIMSQQLLGISLDGIWHSTVEVHNKEIFFSSEITHTMPGDTFYGKPVHVHEYGISERTESEVEAKINELKQKYNKYTYNLLQNNCNHFADELCLFLLNRNLPKYIMEVHEIVLQTPLAPLLSQNGLNFNPGAKRDDL